MLAFGLWSLYSRGACCAVRTEKWFVRPQRAVLVVGSYCPWLQPLDSGDAPSCVSLMEDAASLPRALYQRTVQMKKAEGPRKVAVKRHWGPVIANVCGDLGPETLGIVVP